MLETNGQDYSSYAFCLDPVVDSCHVSSRLSVGHLDNNHDKFHNVTCSRWWLSSTGTIWTNGPDSVHDRVLTSNASSSVDIMDKSC